MKKPNIFIDVAMDEGKEGMKVRLLGLRLRQKGDLFLFLAILAR